MSDTVGEVITEIFDKIELLAKEIDLISEMPVKDITQENQQALKKRFNEARASVKKLLKHSVPATMLIRVLGKAEIIDKGEVQIPEGFVEDVMSKSLVSGESVDDIIVELCNRHGIPEENRTPLARFVKLFLAVSGKREKDN